MLLLKLSTKLRSLPITTGESAEGSAMPVQDRLPVVRVPVLSRAIVEHWVRASSTLLSRRRIPLQPALIMPFKP